MKTLLCRYYTPVPVLFVLASLLLCFGTTCLAEGASSGSGFLVSNQGHILTNAHVVSGCNSIHVRQDDGREWPAKILYVSEREDIAVLLTDIKDGIVARFRSSPLVRLGENVYVFGFPLAGALSTSGNFTSGIVTALAGLKDDTSRIQISAPVQPGNSGGPLLDSWGRVIGIVTSKLNTLKFAAITQDIAQNINFAIKGSVAIDFLSGHGIGVLENSGDKQLAPVEIADYAKKMTYFIECSRDPYSNKVVENASSAKVQRSATYDEEIKAMVYKIVMTTRPEALGGITSFFADSVFFYGKDTSRDSVFAQKVAYLKRWELLNYQIIDCAVSSVPNTDEFVARAKIKFYGKRVDKEVRGITETVWTFKPVLGNLKVSSENSKILERF